jgi:hypothetical protein
MRKIKILFLFIFMFSTIFASEAMNRIQGFMPTVTESAGLANAVNVYMKIADWVRATNAVVRNMRGAVNDIRRARQAVEDIISTAQAMRNFSFYDMDTWAMTVDNSKLIVGLHTNTILRSMGNFELHAIGGVRDFMNAHDSIMGFDIRDEQNRRRRLITQTLSPSSDESYISGIFDEIRDRDHRIQLLEQTRLNLLNEARSVNQQVQSLPQISEERRQLEAELRQLNRRISRIDGKIRVQRAFADSTIFAIRADTIIADAKDVMSQNLMEVERIHSMTRLFYEHAAEMINTLERLARNNISAEASGRTSISASESDNFSRVQDSQGNSIFGDHPNQAPTPNREQATSAIPRAFGAMDRAEVNTQDVIQARNQINLILLRQEQILRNIDVMKANAFAYLMIIDGHNRSADLMLYDAMTVFAHRHRDIAQDSAAIHQ